jgi:acyl-CoA hydrolase
MLLDEKKALLERWRERYPEKFATEETIFSKIRRGHHIFISTGCGEPQYLVRALVNYVQSHPKAIFDAEVFHVWTLGVAPYTLMRSSDITFGIIHSSLAPIPERPSIKG